MRSIDYSMRKPSSKIFDLSGRAVILTGAAGLLGAQYADGLSQVGANVVLTDVNYSRCKKIAKDLESKYNVTPLAIKLDITNQESVKKMVSIVLKKFKKIDILVNNAAFNNRKKNKSAPFEKFLLSTWNKMLSVNLTGMFLCTKEVGRVMLRQKHGVIINIGSIYGMVGADQRIYGKSGINSSIAYATTKSGVLNFTRYLAAYWNRTGIRVNSLSLGGVENNQDSDFIKNYSYRTILGRMAHKDEYVGALLFLASDASSYVTGSNLVVDGGWTAW